MPHQKLPRLPIREFPFDPLTYPGRRPRFSFLFTHCGIYRFNLRNLDQLLARRSLPSVSERYAILAYGSNACPSQLFRKYQRNHTLTEVPVLFGRLIGAEAVYTRRCTASGYIPATLARRAGSRPSWLTLLTRRQIQAMDSTEGRSDSYVLAEVSKMQFFLRRARFSPLYAYVDTRGGVMIFQGQPLSLRSLGQKRCQSIFERTTRQNAETWLDFKEIPAPQAPPRGVRILRR